jgi:hypothetical protein
MKNFVDAIRLWISRVIGLKQAECELIKSWPHLATKDDLKTMENKIMSAISEFAAKQAAFNDRIDAAVAGITGDIKTLNDLITTLQNTPGPISAEDQATLDALEAKGAAIAEKLEALDAVTPPAPAV